LTDNTIITQSGYLSSYFSEKGLNILGKESRKGYSLRLREIRETLDLSIAEFARQLDVPRSTLVGWEGEKGISIEVLKPLETTFNVNIDWLLTGKGEMFSSKKKGKHPLIEGLEALIDQRLEKIEAQIAELKGQIKAGTPKGPDSGIHVSEPEPEYGVEIDITFVEGVAAGKPIFQSEARSAVPVPGRFIKTRPEDYYVGRIKGTSMTAAGIPDGCLALFRISDAPRDGAIQIVEYQGEATVKRMREVPGKGWKICFEDGSEKVIEIGPGDEFHIQGDFIAVLPE
jgi:SOS-response transcriptional repressor LexA